MCTYMEFLIQFNDLISISATCALAVCTVQLTLILVTIQRDTNCIFCDILFTYFSKDISFLEKSLENHTIFLLFLLGGEQTVKECLGSRALALFAARLGDIPAERYLLGCLEAPTNLQHQSLTGTQGSQGFQRKILHKEALHTREVVISVVMVATNHYPTTQKVSHVL